MANPTKQPAQPKDSNGTNPEPKAETKPVTNPAPADVKPAALVASKPALPVPDTSLDLSDEATKRLEEYKATIYRQTLTDKVTAALTNPDMTVASFGGFVGALVEKNGQAALTVLNELKMSDIMPRQEAKKNDSTGAAGIRVREKADTMTDEDKAGLKAKLSEGLAKAPSDGYTIGQLSKLIDKNSPTTKILIDEMTAAKQSVQVGESRSTRYQPPAANTKQPELLK